MDRHRVQVALDFAQPLGGAIDYDYILILLAQPTGKLKSELTCANDDDSRFISLQTDLPDRPDLLDLPIVQFALDKPY